MPVNQWLSVSGNAVKALVKLRVTFELKPEMAIALTFCDLANFRIIKSLIKLLKSPDIFTIN